MAERKGIDPTILEHIVAGSIPDLSRGKPNEEASKIWPRIERRARLFVQRYGHNSDSFSLAIKEPTNRTRIPTRLELHIDYLAQMAERMHLRIATFYYGEIPLNLMTTNPGDEGIILAERGNPRTRLVRSPALYIGNKWAQSRLLFAIGALKDSGDNFSLGIPPVNGEAISDSMVACVKTILTLGERHFAMQHHVPSPS